MLYFYKSISPHPIENLHKYLHNFYGKLFNDKVPNYVHKDCMDADFIKILESCKETIDEKLKAIHGVYIGLKPEEKAIVKEAYFNNNDIESICNKTVMPIKYDALPEPIQEPLKQLYGSEGSLYKIVTNKDNYKEVKNKCGNIRTHTNDLLTANLNSVCPYCGLNNLLTKWDKDRDAYDHYLPKSEYPFCSINFNNLTPICDRCNKGSNKGNKDIPYLPNVHPLAQEVLYYPYCNSLATHKIAISIKGKPEDLKDQAKWSLEFNCTPSENKERMERWKEIYNIETRYKSRIIKDSYSRRDQIVAKYSQECKKEGRSFAYFRNDVLNSHKDYVNIANGIVFNALNECIINDPNCEANLSGSFVF